MASHIILRLAAHRCVFLAGECNVGAWGRTGDDTGLGILDPRAAAGDVSPANGIVYHSNDVCEVHVYPDDVHKAKGKYLRL